MIEKSFVDKETFPLARAARTALVSNIPHVIHAKAVLVKILAQCFKVNRLAAIRLVCIVERNVDDGEGVGVSALIEKGELFAAEFGIDLLQLP